MSRSCGAYDCFSPLWFHSDVWCCDSKTGAQTHKSRLRFILCIICSHVIPFNLSFCCFLDSRPRLWLASFSSASSLVRHTLLRLLLLLPIWSPSDGNFIIIAKWSDTWHLRRDVQSESWCQIRRPGHRRILRVQHLLGYGKGCGRQSVRTSFLVRRWWWWSLTPFSAADRILLHFLYFLHMLMTCRPHSLSLSPLFPLIPSYSYSHSLFSPVCKNKQQPKRDVGI